jgi:small-conductance mechanosensitive channel
MSAPGRSAVRLVSPLACLLLLLGARALLPDMAPAPERALGVDAVALVGRGLAIGAWLAAASLLVRALDLVVWRRRRPPVPRLLTDLVAAVIWLAAALIIAQAVLALPMMGILTTSGVAVAVIGFALRDMLSSLFAGIALTVERPYRQGDWLEITPGTVGQVTEIVWLTTRLLTNDRLALVVPNAQLATRSFANYRQPGDGAWRDQIAVTLGYEVSPARAERILLAAAASVAGANATGDPPDARIAACGEHGVTWHLRWWLSGYAQRVELRHAMHEAVLHHLYQSGLGPVHRRLDLFHAPMPARALEHGGQIDLLLGRSDLFGHLAPAELATLAAAARRCRVSAGTVVVREGEPGHSLFVVVEGLLDVHLTFDGRSRKVRDVRPGDLFGEYSLLTGAPRSATVTARTDCILFEITKSDLEPVLTRSPELARSMSVTLAARQAERPLLADEAIEPAHAPELDEHGLLGRIRSFFGLAHHPG